ncbi:MAG TPA: phosphosulfolactate synthase [Bryobacteraceae bacterium]|nr:phosphosulfolactate synthase [Bryobacteraceae bacterium]
MPTVILARKGTGTESIPVRGHITATEYLHQIGVPQLRPCTAPFDPGYDLSTVEGHLAQSANLMEVLKISMACWIIADETVTRRKVAAAAAHSVPTVTGNGLFQIAVAQNLIESYLDLCADFGVVRVECGESHTAPSLRPSLIVKMAHARGLEVQFQLGGHFSARETIEQMIDQGDSWLNAGAVQIAAPPGDVEHGAGYFDIAGHFNPLFAERLVRAFGIDIVTFSAPDPATQFALLQHFGRDVHLCDVRLEDLLNVESFRRGLHTAAWSNEQLHPGPPGPVASA